MSDLTKLEMALAQRDALARALQNIIDANNDFRKGMPDDWDGDLLQDACDAANFMLNGPERQRP